ncbi:PAS domain-containing protein, partial [Oceanospirillum sp. HFRX-1_2]
MNPVSSAHQKKSSLYLITMLVMVSAALVFSGYGAFTYHWQQVQLEDEIIGQTQESAARLANTLSPYIESYQVNEYDKLMSHEIRTHNHSALSAIVVDDYKMGEITGRKAYTTGWQRTPDGVISIDDEKASKESLLRYNLYFAELDITGSAGEVLGRVRVYANNNELKKRSRALLLQIVVSMLVLMLVLSFVLVLLLKHLFIRPLQALAAAVEQQGEEGIPRLVEPVSPYREISRLTDAMARMLETIRRTQEALHKEHQSLENIVEGTRAGTWRWNVQTGETVINERWAEMAGYSLEELEPVSIDTWLSLAHPEDLEKSEKLLKKHFSGENSYYECEVRMRHKAGHWIWIQDRGRVATWLADGQPLEMFGTHLEITEIKEYQEQLRHIAHYDMLTG